MVQVTLTKAPPSNIHTLLLQWWKLWGDTTENENSRREASQNFLTWVDHPDVPQLLLKHPWGLVAYGLTSKKLNALHFCEDNHLMTKTLMMRRSFEFLNGNNTNENILKHFKINNHSHPVQENDDIRLGLGFLIGQTLALDPNDMSLTTFLTTGFTTGEKALNAFFEGFDRGLQNPTSYLSDFKKFSDDFMGHGGDPGGLKAIVPILETFKSPTPRKQEFIRGDEVFLTFMRGFLIGSQKSTYLSRLEEFIKKQYEKQHTSGMIVAIEEKDIVEIQPMPKDVRSAGLKF